MKLKQIHSTLYRMVHFELNTRTITKITRSMSSYPEVTGNIQCVKLHRLSIPSKIPTPGVPDGHHMTREVNGTAVTGSQH